MAAQKGHRERRPRAPVFWVLKGGDTWAPLHTGLPMTPWPEVLKGHLGKLGHPFHCSHAGSPWTVLGGQEDREDA